MPDTEEKLREALEQLLDDMGETGLCVCQAAKDQAREALSLPERKEGDSIQATLSAPSRHQSAVTPAWTLSGDCRSAVADVLELLVEDGTPHPRDLDVALDAIEQVIIAHARLTAEPSQSGAGSALELHTSSPPGDPNS